MGAIYYKGTYIVQSANNPCIKFHKMCLHKRWNFIIYDLLMFGNISINCYAWGIHLAIWREGGICTILFINEDMSSWGTIHYLVILKNITFCYKIFWKNTDRFPLSPPDPPQFYVWLLQYALFYCSNSVFIEYICSIIVR